MHTTVEQLHALIKAKEAEHLEFKEAKERFDFEKLVRYCVALANEGGGKIVLGVSDKKPRRVVGTQAFSNMERTKAGLLERLHVRVETAVVDHPNGRVLVFTVPSRPIGTPIHYKGAYWMRGGEDLVPMTPDILKKIFDESQPDFSAELCEKATEKDLHPDAIKTFRNMWRRRSGNTALEHLTHRQLLSDAELMVGDGVTFAALILLGTREALGRHLAQSEVVFEYRSAESSIAYQQRKEYRQGFFLFQDDLWETINLRNDKYHYQEGLFVWDIPTFNESVIREAILNAVSHREYRLGGSVFVRQFPKRIDIVSPGGFPPGITAENILWRQFPRNRRIAEAFAKCGLVERSGQGADRMFENSVKESKLPPDYSGTDDHQVSLVLHGEIQDPLFLRFLEQIGKETLSSFNTTDLIVLDLVHREKPISRWARDRLPLLRRSGVIEKIGSKYMLSRRFYQFVGRKGVYTRKRGLDRETNKALLLKHIRDNKAVGSRLNELRDVLPALSHDQVQKLLAEMKREQSIHVKGRTRAARWYPGANGEDSHGKDIEG
jgi:ATP-dependent DNA helicase RecG